MQKLYIKVYRKHSDAIFKHCYFRVFDRERALELMQETFVRTWDYLVQGKKVDNTKAFLYRTANNLIIDESRKKKEQSLEQMQEKGFDACDEKNLEQLENDVELSKLKDLISKIDEKHRQVIVMRYINDLSPKMIAKVLGEKQNVVSVRIYRAVEKLKKLI